MKTETVTMHDLKDGDLVQHYGVIFKLRDRKDHGMRPDDDADLQGACITFKTDVIDASNRSETFPKAWLKDWVFQGNKLMTVKRVAS